MTKTEFEQKYGIHLSDIGRNIQVLKVNSFYRHFCFPTLEIKKETKTPWTKTNFERVEKQLPDWKEQCKTEFKEFKKTEIYRESKRKMDIIQLAKLSGLEDDEGFGSSRGDWFILNIIDYAWRKKDLKKFHASGKFLAIINQTRKRVYANSCDWGPSITNFHFLVGTNENGNAFHHTIPNYIDTVKDAVKWIWNNAEIVQRQGDVGLAPSKLKHVDGIEDDINITEGHTRHRFIGKIHRNSALYVKNGFLYHTAEQHPTLYVGNEWMRVVIAKQSTATISSAD